MWNTVEFISLSPLFVVLGEMIDISVGQLFSTRNFLQQTTSSPARLTFFFLV